MASIRFVSGDLRSHPVGYFLENVLTHWDPSRMEAIAYTNHRSHDALTARLQTRFGAWRDISCLSDEAAERLIRADRVDVLVDLSGHTPYNRLPLFARRAASVQASWLGYWASTGVAAIDYVLSDPVSVPADGPEQFTESVWHLPETRLCFSPPGGAAQFDVSAPPAVCAGHVTFGSFQSLAKVNDAVLRVWAQVMLAIPGSRLRLQAVQLKDSDVGARLLERLAGAGIEAARVDLARPVPRSEYLAAHAAVDILLDTFPHGGATTTCEALWMGVPTVTLAGETMLARQGASILGCAGLRDWVARDEDEYVELAVRHARDVEALAQLRSVLRQRVEQSPLFDGGRFAAALQHALRAMWQRKVCNSHGAAQR